MLQDAHLHLQDIKEQKDLDIMLSCASSRGVGRFFCNGSAPGDWEKIRALSAEHDAIVPFFGVHPWYVEDAASGWEEKLAGYLKDDRANIGEIGLDRAKRGISFEAQQAIFVRQLRMVRELKKPFTVHCVDAWGALVESIRVAGVEGVPFIVHWFSGTPEIAQELIKLGAYISFSPRLMYEAAAKTRLAFERVPVDRVLLETDFPYMANLPKGKDPTPDSYFDSLKALYEVAARLKNMAQEEFRKKVWDNGTIFAH